MNVYNKKVVPALAKGLYTKLGWKEREKINNMVVIEKLKGDTSDKLFEALLRERYSSDQEIEVLRSRDSDADSYRVYQDYVTECKAAVDSIFPVEEVCDCKDCDCEVKEEVCDCEATDVVAKEDTPVEAIVEDKKESE